MGRGRSAALARRFYRRAGAWHDGTHDEGFRRGTHCADDKRRAPVPDETVEALKLCREVHFRARNDRGRDELEVALRAVALRVAFRTTATSGLILRSGRRPRLEGWQLVRAVHPSFETRARARSSG